MEKIKNEIKLDKRSYYILKYYQKHEGLSADEITIYSLYLFDYLHKNIPSLMVKIFEDIINEMNSEKK